MPRQPSKTVVFCIEALTIGGAEQMLVTMANRLIGRGWQVHMFFLAQKGELSEKLDSAVYTHVLDKQGGFDRHLPRKLRKLLKSLNLNPTVVNSHLWVANFWTRLSLIGTSIPVIVTEHSRDFWKPVHYRLIDRLLSWTTYKLVAVSNDVASFYRDEIRIPSKLITVINNGVDVAKYAAGAGANLRSSWVKSDQLLIGTVGRMVPAKNHMRLLDMASMLRDDGIDFKLVIVGDGPERANIEAGLMQRKLEQHVILLGARDDIPDVLAALDIFVLSSDREGHPLTALEAQAAGTPVVLTNAGGSADAIATDGDKCGGLLVDLKAEDLAQAVAHLSRNRKQLADMAQFGQAYAFDHFDTEFMVDQYETLFLSVNR